MPCAGLAINCKDCASPTVCNVCNPPYILYQQQCLLIIPATYVNVTGVATPCSSPCLTCATLPNNCTSCAINYYHNGICISVCPVSHYSNSTSNTCNKCISPCSTCTNSTSCLSCLPSTNTYYNSATMQCINPCPSLYYNNNS
jgi:proprotein convertase subtilisin/kexin type 5